MPLVRDTGCFAEGDGTRLVPDYLWPPGDKGSLELAQTTVALCAQLAAAKGYSVFAIQYQYECRWMPVHDFTKQ